MESIVSDLKILCENSKRDIENKQYFNDDYYLTELNRIIAILKQEETGLFADINTVRKVSPERNGILGEHAAKLIEIHSVATKLYARLTKDSGTGETKIDTLTTLETIFNHFHQIARQLRNRYNSRPTIDVSDEYDVHDLLHALLRIYYDDIRPEEWTPSYAGGSSRMDFLLKNEQVVIEVKKTREQLRDKEIGEQLIIDIIKYKAHPDCKTLACFVYDPGGKIGNPTGLENDLAKLSTDNLGVKVYIFPK